MADLFSCYASSAFGMEGLVSDELKSLGFSDVKAENGGVLFSAAAEQLFRCNLWMHFSDRVYVILASERCTTFEGLFQLVSSVYWPDYLSGNESIDISCKCSRSQLMSPRDCQSITKKAIIESMRRFAGQKVFPESGPSLSVHVSVRNDLIRIMLNTSGDALSRRGYRTWNGEAPLRETLAAALIRLSPWRPGMPLHDPCCGTGTILAEAALIMTNRAPGINRPFFSMEKYKVFRNVHFSQIRNQVAAEAVPDRISGISGSDIDSEAVELARRHFRQAGIPPEKAKLSVEPLERLSLTQENGVFICNPPYGERMSEQIRCRKLYHELNLLQQRHPTWHICVITSDPAFERSFGRKADRKRRLYNGRLECVYYIYD